jgi:hypothetical protein
MEYLSNIGRFSVLEAEFALVWISVIFEKQFQLMGYLFVDISRAITPNLARRCHVIVPM